MFCPCTDSTHGCEQWNWAFFACKGGCVPLLGRALKTNHDRINMSFLCSGGSFSNQQKLVWPLCFFLEIECSKKGVAYIGFENCYDILAFSLVSLHDIIHHRVVQALCGQASQEVRQVAASWHGVRKTISGYVLSLSTQGNGVPFPNQRPYLVVTTQPPFWGAMLEETPLGPHTVNLQGTVFLWLGGAVAGLTGAVRERRSTPQGEVGDLSRPVSTTKTP